MNAFDKIRNYIKSLTRQERQEVRRRLVHDGGGGGSDELYIKVTSYVVLDGTIDYYGFKSHSVGSTSVSDAVFVFDKPYIEDYELDSVSDFITFPSELFTSYTSVEGCYNNVGALDDMEGPSHTLDEELSTVTDFYDSDVICVVVSNYENYVNSGEISARLTLKYTKIS